MSHYTRNSVFDQTKFDQTVLFDQVKYELVLMHVEKVVMICANDPYFPLVMELYKTMGADVSIEETDLLVSKFDVNFIHSIVYNQSIGAVEEYLVEYVKSKLPHILKTSETQYFLQYEKELVMEHDCLVYINNMSHNRHSLKEGYMLLYSKLLKKALVIYAKDKDAYFRLTNAFPDICCFMCIFTDAQSQTAPSNDHLETLITMFHGKSFDSFAELGNEFYMFKKLIYSKPPTASKM